MTTSFFCTRNKIICTRYYSPVTHRPPLSENTNLLIALSPKQTPLTSLATQFSLILLPPDTPLISHHSARSEPQTTIPVPVSSSSPILTPGIPPIWFTGAPHALGSTPMLVPILCAPAESFATDSTSDPDSDTLVSASKKGSEGLWAGSQMGLLTGFQTNMNSCVVFAGGMKMFSDKYARKELPSEGAPRNALFMKDVAAWVFQEKMKLRIDAVDHHWVGESSAPEMYTTNDEIVYTVHISAYDSRTSTWKPYSSIGDLQLEFTMLDPHIRTSLPAVAGSPGTYQVQFHAPDRHGVFKFVLNWKRKGYSYLESSTTIPVVLPRHDQNPCFLSAAWPYFAGAISTSVGFFLFAALWLAGDIKGKWKNVSPPPISHHLFPAAYVLPIKHHFYHPFHSSSYVHSSIQILFHPHPAINSIDHIPIKRAIYLLCPSLHPPTCLSQTLDAYPCQLSVLGRKAFGLQTEHEMCQYLEWELSVDLVTLREFEDMVKKDFTTPPPTTNPFPPPPAALAPMPSPPPTHHGSPQNFSGSDTCAGPKSLWASDRARDVEFEDMVKKDFVGQGPYLTYILPSSSKTTPPPTTNPFPPSPSYGHCYPLPPKPTFFPSVQLFLHHTTYIARQAVTKLFNTDVSGINGISSNTPRYGDFMAHIISALSSPGIPKHEPAPYTLVKGNTLVLILSNH
ncbi:hypothetical protein CY34DRAFT_16931 [Suillus luteus UH-Slu-Lm8-n1]|uniref:Dolichyl-diphosphooligosaccharide--protein glycosyltransferase subunit WBP1 n=1 Tax=Suillus luteus UH-Slu-Lm8-n1 TaxID=930992 RepID=A0A0D0A1G1_9AGAM|nr:hypothetical protein CY34DRAFT_16931 [Suillus luteus UH-Slu-Lm8-n1]